MAAIRSVPMLARTAVASAVAMTSSRAAAVAAPAVPRLMREVGAAAGAGAGLAATTTAMRMTMATAAGLPAGATTQLDAGEG